MIVKVVVDNRVRVQVEGLDPKVRDELKNQFQHVNPKHIMLKKIRKPTWNEPRIISTWDEEWKINHEQRDKNEKWMTFPRGGLQRVRDVLVAAGVEMRGKDRRSAGAGDFTFQDFPDHRMTLWDHQWKFVDAALEKENCILRAPTGSGKTCCGFAIIARAKVPSLVLVPDTSLLRQWQERAEIELGLKMRDVGLIRGKVKRLRPLTLALPQTIAAHGVDEEMQDYFGLILCDEAQLFAARTFFAAVDPWKARYRFAISADHTRKDRKEFLITDLFGSVAASISKKAVVEAGHILEVETRVIPSDFRADWYGMPEDPEKPDVFGEAFGDAASLNETPKDEKQIDFNRLVVEMLNDADRNAIVYGVVADEVKNEEHQVLVFAHRREHCLRIDQTLDGRGFKTGFLIGGDDFRKEFIRTKDGLKQGEIDVGVGTYKGAGTGLDLPSIGVGVAVTPIAANRQFFKQLTGRLCRASKGTGKTTNDARLYYVWDRHVFPGHLKNLIAWSSRCVVWDGSEWVNARHYMKARKNTGT